MKFGSLSIKFPSGQTREFSIDQATLSIGRAQGNDLTIEDTSVSRRHVRLSVESGRLMVEDLGSANGTFIDSQRLPPNSPSLATEGQVVRLGDVELRYAPPPPIDFAPPPASVNAAGPVGPVGQPVNIALVGPVQPAVPGSTTNASLTVQNRGTVVDELIIQVTGIPADWVRLGKERVSLLPQAQEQIAITFQPPRRSEATAGDHAFAITVTSREHQFVVTAAGTLKVRPYQSVTLNLQPQRSRRDFQLIMTNLGNVSVAYRLSGVDEEQALSYRFGQAKTALPPGQSATIPLEVTSQNVPRVGNRETRLFSIVATQVEAAGDEVRAAGQLIIRPPIPTWLIAAVGALAIVLIAVAANVIGSSLAVGTRVAANTPIIMTNVPTANVPIVQPGSAATEAVQINQAGNAGTTSAQANPINIEQTATAQAGQIAADQTAAAQAAQAAIASTSVAATATAQANQIAADQAATAQAAATQSAIATAQWEATRAAAAAVSDIVMIGASSLALGEAANNLQTPGSLAVSVNSDASAADLVLFTVYAPDGPMPNTVREIERLQGQTISRAAILLTGVDVLSDPELQQLVVLEFRELLARYLGNQANAFEVLRMPDPALISKIQALLILPPTNLPVNAPSP